MRTEYLLDKEMEHVLAALTPENRLVCEVSLHTGLRVGDVLSLRSAQIKPTFWVKESKTKKSKKVGLPSGLLSRMRAISGPVWVFTGKRDENKHRTRQAVWADVKRASKAFRLPQNIAPHSLRKVYAVRLLEKYGDIAKVSRALNHDSATTTLLYAMADKLYTARYGGVRQPQGLTHGDARAERLVSRQPPRIPRGPG